MQFLTQLIDRSARRAADRLGEYRALLRKAVRSDGQLNVKDSDRLAVAVDELKLSPADVEAHAAIVRRYDTAKPRADELPGVRAELDVARQRVVDYAGERDRVARSMAEKADELLVPVHAMEQRALVLTGYADEAYRLEQTEWDLLGTPPPATAPVFRQPSAMELEAIGHVRSTDERPHHVKLAAAMRDMERALVRQRTAYRKAEVGKAEHEREVARAVAEGAAGLTPVNMLPELLPDVLADAAEELAVRLAAIDASPAGRDGYAEAADERNHIEAGERLL